MFLTRSDIFSRLSASSLFLFTEKKIGVTICEDIWTEHYLPRPLYDCEPVRSLVEQRRGDYRESELVAVQLAQAGDSLTRCGRSRSAHQRRSPTAI